MSEPSNPWVAGVEMLYTREFLEAARSRLALGGVYGQWFHVYETDREVVNLILRTYASVFPHVSVWYMTGPDLLVLGMDRPGRALDVRALESRFRQPDFAAAFGRVEIDRFPQLLAHELIPLGTLHAEELEGPIHSLRRPILSDLAARAFFVGAKVGVDAFMSENHQKVSVGNSLLRRYAGRRRAAAGRDLRDCSARDVPLQTRGGMRELHRALVGGVSGLRSLARHALWFAQDNAPQKHEPHRTAAREAARPLQRTGHCRRRCCATACGGPARDESLRELLQPRLALRSSGARGGLGSLRRRGLRGRTSEG